MSLPPSPYQTAFDLSPAALEVAAINVKAHRLGKRVTLHRSDVFDAVPAVMALLDEAVKLAGPEAVALEPALDAQAALLSPRVHRSSAGCTALLIIISARIA